MLECPNGGLEGLGGLESLEFRGNREKGTGNRELELPPRTSILWGTGRGKKGKDVLA
jgi:hypothetical protein